MKGQKAAYPVILTPDEKYVVVYVPDFNINTQGKDYSEAIEMSRDAIGMMAIDIQEDNETIPTPSDVKSVAVEDPGAFVTLVDVDFDEYRRRHDNRVVRRNVTLPAWLDERASRSGINVSGVLQKALKAELNL